MYPNLQQTPQQPATTTTTTHTAPQPVQPAQPATNTHVTIQMPQQQSVPMQQPLTQPVYYAAHLEMDDDPTCIYVCAVLGFLWTLVGLIAMCCFNCGKNLPPRKLYAYKVLVGCTIAGLILNVIILCTWHPWHYKTV